ncbi:hypothetical protein F4803DRAFT_574659 [Xylaria telfairii]|nr:hypothetical protein F4803DRAFT_574659 [Xylaria telfairii]
MSSDVESAETVDVIVTDIKTIVAKRLREEHLDSFVHTRNNLLELERSSGHETERLLHRQHVRSVDKTWNRVLQTLRSELPNTLDQLINNLQPEFQDAAGLSPSLVDSKSAMPPVSAESPSVTNYTFNPAPAPASGVSIAASPTANRARSVTLAPNTSVFDEDEEQSMAMEAETPVFNSTDISSNKRALGPEDPEITSSSKKAKKIHQTYNRIPGFRMPIKRSMYLRDVKERECIFSFDDYFGVYILRCNFVRCKKRLKQDGPIIFRSHPFRGGLALEHFNGEGHNIDSEADVFHKFAIRITDASTERNTERRHDSVFDSSCSEVDLSSLPASPKKSRDKGKKPERPYNLYSPRKPEASIAESASNANETFRDSFYRAGPLLSISGSTLPRESSTELPPGASGNEHDAD